MMWDAHDGMGWWMVWGSVFWIVVLAAVGAFIYWIVSAASANSRGPGTPPPRSEDDALAIARRRYASGEITREQFEQLRRDLSS